MSPNTIRDLIVIATDLIVIATGIAHPGGQLMAQDTEMIGQVSPELNAVAAQKEGWQGAAAEPLGTEYTDASDYSRWDRKSNNHLLGLSIPNMAGHVETPMAAVGPTCQP